MFKKGNFVINAKNGICEIQDIVTMNMSGTKKDYLMLVPIEEKTAKVYIPVDTAEQRIRRAMTKEDAYNLINSIKTIDETYIENEKEREKTYKEAITSRDPKRLVGIIKTIYVRKQKRIGAGKKITAVDERYFKAAENQLHSELAFALDVPKNEIAQLIISNI